MEHIASCIAEILGWAWVSSLPEITFWTVRTYSAEGIEARFIERQNAGGYRIIFNMFGHAGNLLVQGTAPQELSHTRDDITIDIPIGF
jgi:hypothetical protein